MHPILLSSPLPRLPRRFVLALLGTLVLSAPAPAVSIEVDSLYTVEVVLDPEDREARDNAYQMALTEVLVRVTGSVEAALAPDMADIFPEPARYVTQYRNGAENALIVTFDGEAIEAALRRAGKTVWGSDRPLTLLWLAVNWGDGEREIVAANDAERRMGQSQTIDRDRLLRERIDAVATMRGLPVVLPLLDTEDLANVSFGEIWGGFDDRLLQASRRYGTSSILVGRIRPDAATPNRWTYYLGAERRDWQGEPETVLNQLADALAAEFAFAGNAAAETIMLTISGIDSVVAYGAVQELMANLNQIDGFAIDRVTGDRIRYRVQVRGGVDRLSRALQLSDVLEASTEIKFGIDPDGGADGQELDFVYRAARAGATGFE